MNIEKINNNYNNLTYKIKERWKELTNLGDKIFDHWELGKNNNIKVYYKTSNGHGESLSSTTDIIPIICIECETLQEAEEFYKIYKAGK